MKLKLRQDLEFIKRQKGYDQVWVVKDPVSFHHYLFTSQECYLLKLFDGDRNEEDILEMWSNQFKSAALSIDQLRGFMQRLIQDNLVTVQKFGYGNSLYKDLSRKQVTSLVGLLANPLAIRFRGVNPAKLLKLLSPIGWLLFHPAIIVLNLILAMGVLVFMIGHFEEIESKIPTIEQLLSSQGIIGLILMLAIIKVLHEIGHALSCQRYGGECFEIGLILLAFIPTLYCNVTDAWTFPERWKRIMVSFAGVYVEICLAALAAIGWFLTDPGLLNAMLFNIVALCSLNTLLVNGNPLLRYDGYYILSDLTEQPNLGAQGSAAVKEFLSSWIWVPDQRTVTSRPILIYGLMSFLYRWFVVGAILIGIVYFLKGLGLKPFAYIMVVVVLAGMLSTKLSQLRANMKSNKRKTRKLSLIRSGLTLVLFLFVLFLFLYLPLPRYVYASLVVEPRDPALIFAPTDGQLSFVADPYSRVNQNDSVGRLENVELEFESRIKNDELLKEKNILKQLRLRENDDPSISSRIAIVKEKILSLTAEVEILDKELASLNLKSPIDGIVMPAVFRPDQIANRNQQVSFVSDRKNSNCFLSSSELVASIVDPENLEFVLFVGENDIGTVAIGQEVTLVFDQVPEGLSHGQVVDIYEVDVKSEIRIGSGDIELETYTDAKGQSVALQTPYRVIVNVEERPSLVFVGSTGKARIGVPAQTAWERTKSFFKHLVNTEL